MLLREREESCFLGKSGVGSAHQPVGRVGEEG